MPSKSPLSALVLSSALLGGCVTASGPTVAQVTPATPATLGETAQPSAPADPVSALIAQSEQHFAAGQSELALGHLEGAKAEFDRALDIVLESPGGARADARLQEHFDRLVERVSALELAALATGDGFTESRSDPASIDTLLEIGGLDTAEPMLSTAEAVEADLETTVHDIPIPPNAKVLRYVELFQGRLREFLADGLNRGAQYLPMIQSVFRSEGLPLDLAYVPLIESAFKPSALSRTRARGVWQFMKGTALENGLAADWYIDERADPEKATAAAAKYMKTLYGMFDDWHLAMASYNGGPGRVQRAMKRSRKDDFWDLSATTRYLPRETREYVPMILAAIIIAKNPSQYGFDIQPTAAPRTETVNVPAALDLRRVAEWAEVPMADIQSLNPEFRRWTTPVKEGDYAIKVPEGTADKVRDGLAAAAPHQLNALQWHVVKKGETLSTIAKKLRVSRADLAEANYLKTSSRVRIGQRLVIPRMPSAALLAKASTADTPTEVDVLKETVALGPADGPVYRVRKGDTLYAIARRNGVTVQQLQAWNHLRGSKLNIGDRLVLQAPAAATNQQ